MVASVHSGGEGQRSLTVGIVVRRHRGPVIRGPGNRQRNLAGPAEGDRHLDPADVLPSTETADRHDGRARRRDGRRRHAGERLGVVGVVGEAHLHLDRLALVGRHQRVGARRRAGDVRLGAAVHLNPLERVADGGQPVGIHDGGGDRRQRLPDLRRAGDRRRARRGGVRGGAGGGVGDVGGEAGAPQR